MQMGLGMQIGVQMGFWRCRWGFGVQMGVSGGLWGGHPECFSVHNPGRGHFGVQSPGWRRPTPPPPKSHLPKIYQALLMSATFNPDVEALQELVLHNPVSGVGRRGGAQRRGYGGGVWGHPQPTPQHHSTAPQYS